MAAPSPATLARLLLALADPRRVAGRLRPLVVGRPHPRRRLARLRLPGAVRCSSLGLARKADCCLLQ